MRRGEIWWTDFEPTQGAEIRKRRPAVVLTVNAVLAARKTVVVVPLSSGPPPRPPVIVAVPSAGRDSVAVCDQLRSLDQPRLLRREGRLDQEDLLAVEAGVRGVLGL